MDPSVIDTREIEFDSASNADTHARVFWWKGQVYRAVTSSVSPFYLRLIEDGLVARLEAKGLVHTEIAPLSLPGYDLVLKHQTVPFFSYPYEWVPQMLKDAALMVCDLMAELHTMSIELQDTHPYNLTFGDGCRPIWTDFGSLQPVGSVSNQGLLSGLIFWYLYPLYASAHQRTGHDIRRLFRCHSGDSDFLQQMVHMLPPFRRLQCSLEFVSLLHCQRYSRRLVALLRQFQRRFQAQQTFRDALDTIRRSIKEVEIPMPPSEWSGYHDDYYADGVPNFQPVPEWSKKERNVHRLLQILRPDSMLDIGTNRGWYSQLAARQGVSVVAMDRDETSIALLYRDVAGTNLPILPLIVDFVRPLPVNIFERSVSDRLRCDLVLALALVHHLVFKEEWHPRFEVIAKQLAGYTNKWLLVEFVPRDDMYVQHWYSDRFDWYSLENFIAALSRFFSKIEVLDSSPTPRKLVLCTKG